MSTTKVTRKVGDKQRIKPSDQPDKFAWVWYTSQASVGETNFWTGFRTPFWGHLQESVLLEGSKWHVSFLEQGLPEWPKTGEKPVSSRYVTVDAASFRPPKTRNLLSFALPFNVVAHAPLFFW